MSDEHKQFRKSQKLASKLAKLLNEKPLETIHAALVMLLVGVADQGIDVDRVFVQFKAASLSDHLENCAECRGRMEMAKEKLKQSAASKAN